MRTFLNNSLAFIQFQGRMSVIKNAIKVEKLSSRKRSFLSDNLRSRFVDAEIIRPEYINSIPPTSP